MQVKSSLLLFSFLFVFFVDGVNVFAEENKGKDLLLGRNSFEYLCGNSTFELTDNDSKTYVNFKTTSSCNSVVYKFDTPVAVSSFVMLRGVFDLNRDSVDISLDFTLSDGSVQKYKFPNDRSPGEKIIPLKLKNVVSVSFKNNSNAFYVRVHQLSLYEYVAVAPNDIENLKESDVTYNSTKFTFNVPKDNFSYVKVFRDGRLIANNVKIEQFTDTGLEGNKEYVYKFVSVSPDGLETKGVEKTIKTLEAPNFSKPVTPPVPTVKERDNSLIVNFPQYDAHVKLKGFNIFVDGKKINDSVVVGRSFTIDKLTNNQIYNVQIQAVSYVDVVSDLTNPTNFKPYKNVIPEISFSFGLDALIESIKAWFASIWGIIAFSICIPLAFIIARNTKHLFLR